jgi:hypothetical protein
MALIKRNGCNRKIGWWLFGIISIGVIALSMNCGMKSEKVFCNREKISLVSSSHKIFSVDISSPAILDIKVVELDGANIDFKVLKDGNQVHYSGVHKGQVTGLVNVEQGNYTVVIMNDNIVDSKICEVTIIARYK